MADCAIGGTLQLNTSEAVTGLDIDQNIVTLCDRKPGYETSLGGEGHHKRFSFQVFSVFLAETEQQTTN